MTETEKPSDNGAGNGGVPPEEDGVIIEFVGHEDEGPHVVGDGDLRADAPAKPAAEASLPSGQAAEYEEKLREGEERILRLRADFDNYRKRADREREDLRRTAAAGLVRDLLPVLDNMERALSNRPEGCPEVFFQGLSLILQQFEDTLKKVGLEEVVAAGMPFDPAFHDACTMAPTTDLPPNHVLDVIQRGFTLAGKLLRPARVRVSAAPSEDGGPHA